MKKSFSAVFGSVGLFGLLWLSPCHAEVAVVVNPANANAVTAEQAAQIFLGKSKKFADGNSATPINQKEGSAVDVFNQSVVKKSASQLKAYWSEIVFTGKGTAPKENGQRRRSQSAHRQGQNRHRLYRCRRGR